MNSKSIPSVRFRLTKAISIALLFTCAVAQTFAADDELDVAMPSDVGLDASKLNEVAARIRSNPNINVHSVLVVKDNKLVFEDYFSGKDQSWGEDLGVVNFDSDSLHDMRSVTKSITSALVGIAISGRPANRATVVGQHRPLTADTCPTNFRLADNTSRSNGWFRGMMYFC